MVLTRRPLSNCGDTTNRTTEKETVVMDWSFIDTYAANAKGHSVTESAETDVERVLTVAAVGCQVY